jgi:hypothetical protein
MRILVRSILALGLALAATPASAQVIHSLQFGVGIVLPRGFDGRESGDVLVENLTGFEIEPGLTSALAFPDVENCFDRFNVTSRPSNCINGFRTGKIFGEWNVAFGDRLEVGVGLGYHRKTVLSLYRDLYNENGSDIEQDIRLRVIPLTGVVRFMPFGRAGDFQPYVGAGLGILNWRYSEVGEFVDTTDFTIFEDRFVANGTTAGPLLLGGIRVPLGGDIYALTLEGLYQWGAGDTGGFDAGFLGDKIDLGNGQFNLGFLIRF